MKTRHYGWIAPALALGLLGAVLYGYNENNQSGAALAALDNQYQAIFHDSVSAQDAMEDALGKTLVSTQSMAVAQQLQDVVHYAEIAQTDYSRLPAGLSGHGKIAAYLGSVRLAAQRLLETHVTGTTFSTADRDLMRRLRDGALRVERAMREVQTGLMGYHNVFVVLSAVSMNKSAQQRSSAWRQLNRLQATAAANTVATTAPDDNSAASYSLSRQQAIGVARGFLHSGLHAPTSVQALADGVHNGGYLVTVRANDAARVAVSPHGAVLWMQRDDSGGGGARTTLRVAVRIAEHFAAAHGISHVAVREADSYSGKATVALCPIVRGVMLFDEPVLIKEDLATGAVIGYDATEYVIGGLPLHSLRPAISLSAAKRAVARGIHVLFGRLAVITSSASGERLVYEFLGTSQGRVYRIFVDARHGGVVDIQKVAVGAAGLSSLA